MSIIESFVINSGKNFLSSLNEKEGARLEELQSSANDKDIKNIKMLYIHIPYCRSLCPFCSFNRYLFNKNSVAEYFKRLKREFDMYLNSGYNFDTIYIGGGTPTVDFDELNTLLEYLNDKLRIKSISIESTARELNEEKLMKLKSLKVKRLSIGAQTLDKKLSKDIGRSWQDPESTLETIKLANDIIDTLSVDLIFNFNTQTLEQFGNDLDILIDAKTKQITNYPLLPSIYSENFKNINRKNERNFYNLLLSRMDSASYKPSTVWCFSRKNDVLSDEYIIEYDSYIGIGSSSISLFKNHFYINSFSVPKYNRLIDNEKIPVVREKFLSQKELAYYFLLNHLFGLKINKEAFKKEFGASIYKILYKEMIVAKALNIIREDSKNIYLKRNGYYIVGSGMRAFLSILNTLREEFRSKQI
ncbi:MAG: radical SAM protein [Candidatus Micrarchaeia archaeon]